MMHTPAFWLAGANLLANLGAAVCPFMDSDADPAALRARQAALPPQDPPAVTDNLGFISQFRVDDANAFMTTDAGGPVMDQASLKAGPRGPTVLEDFVLREKIMHFDHERVSLSKNSLGF